MTTDLIAQTEARRRVLRLSQQSLARELGMTQGYYSKLVRRQVPLSHSTETRLTDWLAQSEERTRHQSEEVERLALKLTKFQVN